MTEVAGVTKCPVCGEDGQEVRINKNRKLYIICDHGCRVNFNSASSRKWLAKLSAGEAIKEVNFNILPIKKQGITAQVFEKPQEKGVIENGKSGVTGIARDTAIRRADGQLAAVAGNIPSPGRPARGFLAEFFSDDDE